MPVFARTGMAEEGAMEELDALLKEIRRVLAPGSPEAPFTWVIIALVGVMLVQAVVALRRRGRGGEVQHLYLAAAAATRKAREISEIDAFARRASATAEELKVRVRKLRTGHFQQVKIYIDHSNFMRTWTEVVHGRDRPLQHDVNWANLPQVLIAEASRLLSSLNRTPQVLVYRGTHVYGTLFQDDYFKLLETMLRMEQATPSKLPLPIRLRKETVDRWREENEAHKVELMRVIQREVGYTMVPIFRRTPREDQLNSCNFTAGGIPIAPEKMLDTHIATDLIGDATFDVYDVALLVSEDSDFVPAVEFVQDMRNKQVVHVGFGSHSNDLRAQCRHRIDLNRDRSFKHMQRASPARAPPPARAAGSQQA
jgi:uncharacterized LabA/DUF88 family protein